MFHINVHAVVPNPVTGGYQDLWLIRFDNKCPSWLLGRVMLDNIGAACFQTKAVSKLGILIVVRMGLGFNQVLIWTVNLLTISHQKQQYLRMMGPDGIESDCFWTMCLKPQDSSCNEFRTSIGLRIRRDGTTKFRIEISGMALRCTQLWVTVRPALMG